jgi:CRISPR-associated protein Csd2
MGRTRLLFVSAKLTERTGFSEEDLKLLWRALISMFEHDRSAARGEMAARRLIAFGHESAMGNAPAHKLFETVKIGRANGGDAPARRFSDYDVAIDRATVPQGVSVHELL